MEGPAMRAVRHLILSFACAVAFLATGRDAYAAPSVALKLTGAIVEHGPSGASHDVPLTSRAAMPGEIIRYTIVASNTGREPVRALTPIGRIPAGTAYVASAASRAGHVEFSLDGKTFSEHPTVVVNGPNGPERRPAEPERYVAVRWSTADTLRPGTSASFDYTVRVR
jgi:uncharacterized repeat protein (TIGR01451 family)